LVYVKRLKAKKSLHGGVKLFKGTYEFIISFRDEKF